MKIVCNCGHEFDPTLKMLHETKLSDDLWQIYFKCPKCKLKQVVGYHNAESKRLQKLIKKARNANDYEKVGEYSKRLKMIMDELKAANS